MTFSYNEIYAIKTVPNIQPHIVRLCSSIANIPSPLKNRRYKVLESKQNTARYTGWNCRRRFLCLRLLWPWSLIFWPQNSISTSTNQNTPVTKIGWNPFISFWDVLFTRFRGSL